MIAAIGAGAMVAVGGCQPPGTPLEFSVVSSDTVNTDDGFCEELEELGCCPDLHVELAASQDELGYDFRQAFFWAPDAPPTGIDFTEYLALIAYAPMCDSLDYSLSVDAVYLTESRELFVEAVVQVPDDPEQMWGRPYQIITIPAGEYEGASGTIRFVRE